MNKGLILSIIAGFTTLSGLLFTFNIKSNKNIDKYLTISLSMSFIMLILISLLDLFPESLKILQNKPFLDVFLYIMVNYTIIYIFLKISHKMSKNKVEKGKLYFLGVISMISLLLHNIPEGIISCITTNYNLNLGLKITTSIIIHNIPEGILIALPIYFSTKSRKRASIYVFIAAIGEPLGAFFSLFLLKNKINDVSYIGYIFISVALLMILIAVEEIFPKIKDKNKKYITVGLSIGLIIFLINKLII